MPPSKINRLQTTRLIRPMVDAHWQALRTAKQEGRKTAWCCGPFPELTLSMDIPTHYMAGYAAYVAGTGAIGPLLESAEDMGYLRETCSYHRCHFGMLDRQDKGLPLKEEVRLPVPDIMVATCFCREHWHYAEALVRNYKVPVIPIDLPAPQTESEIGEITTFVERQLKESAIPGIEKALGRTFNWDKLSSIVATLKKAGTLRKECMEMMTNIPSPWSFIDLAVSIAPVQYAIANQAPVEYFEKLKKELEERVSQKIGACEPERFRLYWDGFAPWSFLGVFSRKLAAWGGTLLVGRYPWAMWAWPDELDPEDPLHSLAADIVKSRYYFRTPSRTVDFIVDSIKKYSLDGAIMQQLRTCRMWGIAQMDMVDEIERRTGKPCAIIEMDMVDPEFFSEAQINTRLQATFEIMEARKFGG